jgi:hypothetical protein
MLGPDIDMPVYTLEKLINIKNTSMAKIKKTLQISFAKLLGFLPNTL